MKTLEKMGNGKMPVSVLEHVKGNRFCYDLQKEAGVEPHKTFRVIFIPDDENQNDENQKSPKRKVYSDDVKRIYTEAMKSLDEDIEKGLTKGQSFERLEETMKKIGNHLKQNNNEK